MAVEALVEEAVAAVEAAEVLKMKQTLTGLIAGLALMAGCGEMNSKPAKELPVPAECIKIYNFGYNYAAERYFVACQTKDNGYLFYTRRPRSDSWSETRFVANGRYLEAEKPCR